MCGSSEVEYWEKTGLRYESITGTSFQQAKLTSGGTVENGIGLRRSTLAAGDVECRCSSCVVWDKIRVLAHERNSVVGRCADMCHSSFLLWMNAYGQGLTYCSRRKPSVTALIEVPRIKNDQFWKSEFNGSEWNTVWCQPTFFYSTIVYNCGFFSGPHLSRAGAIDGIFYGDYSMAASIPATQDSLLNDIPTLLTETGMPEKE
ncbi:hypothetical protein K7432_011910 [Basidiobolus ranarum]|uniref:Uncharacterized protein n=1 Tax=Basidiobolus ranarum TaxID=34480 RepID=A0ABR2WLN4_9FUNG